MLLSFEDEICSVELVLICVYKYLSPIISPILCNLVNKSVLTGKFPDSLKIAKIIPLYKGGARSACKNYRPISILPFLNKIFEKVVKNNCITILKLGRYFVQNNFVFEKINLLCNHLSNSCNTCIMFWIVVVMYFLYILLHKMYHYGVRGIVHEWLESYLVNYWKFLNCNNVQSSMCTLTHGVPQGSILSPFLLLILINDLPKSSNLLKFNLFADDSTLSFSFNPIDSQTASLVVNSELKNVYHWICVNKLSINIDITKFIVFSYRKRVAVSPPFNSETKP